MFLYDLIHVRSIVHESGCVDFLQGGGCEFILYRHLPQLVKYLNIDSMRIYLRAEEFLSDDDMEKLTPNPPHYVGSQIVETLVKLVKQNGAKGLKKFLSALKKSVEAGYHSGHKELLELLEKDRSSTEKSAEMNLSLKEADSNFPELNNGQIFCSQLWGPSPKGGSGSYGRSLVEPGNR